ncbi:MAG: deoxyribose-phosphate aldolase [Firmicutes bacterium]|nr:deoxyribose-phosphate aldolase [Bacillota bacterium]
MFDPNDFVPESLFERITAVRVDYPGAIMEEALARGRREVLAPDGKLCILACDHPARRVTSALGDPTAMGDRHDYLGRILRVMSHPEIDGVMATPDIIEDLLIVSHLLRRHRGGGSFLDGKILIGCMNRGGLAGTVFELDDAMTSYTVESMVAHRLDAAKMMFRLDPSNPDSLATMVYCAEAMNALNRVKMPVFLEPLPIEKTDCGYRVKKTSLDMIQTIGVASAMGESTARLWLKIPIVPEFERVARSTTLPLLLLGGESSGNPTEVIREFRRALNAGANVRGALIGRNVLYPGDVDPLGVALAISRMIHRGYSADQAIAEINEVAGFGRDLYRMESATPRLKPEACDKQAWS